MSVAAGAVNGPAIAVYATALGDDALILSERCNELITRSPTIEEDLAIANIGLDLLGQARALLSYAGKAEGAGRTEDDLAYLRTENQFRNAQLMELPNDDFAFTMVRLLLVSEYLCLVYEALCGSKEEQLSAISAKAVKEVTYHRSHSRAWVVRLGRGTDTSALRLGQALDSLAPYVDELFESSWIPPELLGAGVAVDPAELRSQWNANVSEAFQAGLVEFPSPGWKATGGRVGRHSEGLGQLLGVMQSVHRAHPGASW